MTRGIIAAIICIMADQLNKYYMLEIYDIDELKKVTVTSFFNYVMVWNRGISFGMFQDHGKSNYIFLVVSSSIILLLSYLMHKSRVKIESIGLGIIIGGAIGNIIDRIRFGAVADFFDFHYNGYHWPAFNIADSCIFCGAALLIFYSLFLEEKSKNEVSS